MKKADILRCIKTTLVTTIFSVISLSTSFANDYNQLSFSTKAQSEIANDEIQAILYKKSQSSDSKALAIELNQSINKAIKIAKRYPSVTVSTREQNTYPRYGKNSKIIGWTGQASLELKSKDFEATSQLIADLQELLVLDDIYFGVSKEKRDEITQDLLITASKKFQAQAKLLSQAWNASDYKLVNIRLSENNNGNFRSAPIMAAKAMADESVPAPNFESGNSTISVTADGTIELLH